MFAVVPAVPLATRARDSTQSLSSVGENPQRSAQQRDGLRMGWARPPCCLLTTPTPDPQNNQLEKIYPEELSRLHRLETLNLQNNRLTSRGEGSPRAGAGTRQGRAPPCGPRVWERAGLGWAAVGPGCCLKATPEGLGPGSGLGRGFKDFCGGLFGSQKDFRIKELYSPQVLRSDSFAADENNFYYNRSFGNKENKIEKNNPSQFCHLEFIPIDILLYFFPFLKSCSIEV